MTTTVVIEHNQPAPAKAGVIKTADWIVDLGPEGGVRGGEIVAEGTPELLVKEPRSFTGHYLRPMLANQPASAQPALKASPRKSKQPAA